MPWSFTEGPHCFIFLQFQLLCIQVHSTSTHKSRSVLVHELPYIVLFKLLYMYLKGKGPSRISLPSGSRRAFPESARWPPYTARDETTLPTNRWEARECLSDGVWADSERARRGEAAEADGRSLTRGRRGRGEGRQAERDSVTRSERIASDRLTISVYSATFSTSSAIYIMLTLRGVATRQQC